MAYSGRISNQTNDDELQEQTMGDQPAMPRPFAVGGSGTSMGIGPVRGNAAQWPEYEQRDRANAAERNGTRGFGARP